MQAVIEKCRRIATLPSTAVTLADPDVFFVVKNGPEQFLEVLNLSSGYYVEAVESNINSMKVVALSLTIGSVALLTLVVCFVVRPPVYDVERNKEGLILHTLA
jgi:hypothetical protein